MHVGMLGCFSHVQLFETLCTVAIQAPLFLGSSRQEYQSRLLCPLSYSQLPVLFSLVLYSQLPVLYRVSPSLAARNIISLILVLTVFYSHQHAMMTFLSVTFLLPLDILHPLPALFLTDVMGESKRSDLNLNFSDHL